MLKGLGKFDEVVVTSVIFAFYGIGLGFVGSIIPSWILGTLAGMTIFYLFWGGIVGCVFGFINGFVLGIFTGVWYGKNVKHYSNAMIIIAIITTVTLVCLIFMYLGHLSYINQIQYLPADEIDLSGTFSLFLIFVFPSIGVAWLASYIMCGRWYPHQKWSKFSASDTQETITSDDVL